MAQHPNTRAIDRRKTYPAPLGVANDDAAASGLQRSALCPTPHLTVDEFTRLLSAIEDEGGFSTLHDIARALPAVLQPVSAVLDLCDAGVLCADLDAAFDGNTRIWRNDR